LSCIAGVHIYHREVVSYAFISSPPLLAPGGGDPPQAVFTLISSFVSTKITSTLLMQDFHFEAKRDGMIVTTRS